MNLSYILNKELPVKVSGAQYANSNRMAYPITEPKKLTLPTYEGSGQATHPSVIYVANKFKGYHFWMAMTPFPNSAVEHENPSILCSNDGVNWQVPSGATNPVVPLPPQGYNADPSLVHKWDTDELFLYWNVNGISPAQGWLTKSSDGVSWSTPVQTKDKAGNNVIFSGSGMEYIKKDFFLNTGTAQQPGFAHSMTRGIANWNVYKSADGITFERLLDEFDNLTGSHWHSSFKKFADGYHYISSVNRNTEDVARPYDLALYYGYSPDLQSPLFDSTPLMQLDPNKFPSKKLYASCIVPVGHDRSRVYFSGQNVDNTWGIGYFDVALNNPYHFYQQSRLADVRKRILFQDLALRDVDIKTYVPQGEPSWYYGIPELTYFKEKTLVCINTLKDVSGNPVNVKVQMVERHLDDVTRKLRIGAANQEYLVPSDGNYEQIITKEEIKTLGIRQLDRAGIQIQAQSVPASGIFTLYLMTQE